MPHITTAERIGRAEGVQESILELIEARMGSVPAKTASQVGQIFDLDCLRALRKLLVTNAPLEEFMQALNSSKAS